MKIREVRACTADDNISEEFVAYQIIYADSTFCNFGEITSEIKDFIKGKKPKYEKCDVEYPHYVAIWSAEK